MEKLKNKLFFSKISKVSEKFFFKISWKKIFFWRLQNFSKIINKKNFFWKFWKFIFFFSICCKFSEGISKEFEFWQNLNFRNNRKCFFFWFSNWKKIFHSTHFVTCLLCSWRCVMMIPRTDAPWEVPIVTEGAEAEVVSDMAPPAPRAPRFDVELVVSGSWVAWWRRARPLTFFMCNSLRWASISLTCDSNVFVLTGASAREIGEIRRRK